LYVSIRAYVLSFTIDESQSVILAQQSNYWELIRYVKPESNNHFLITIWLKKCISLGIWQEWILRIPCVLATLVFIVFAWRLAKLLSDDFLLKTVFFILFLANPFVADFFSLARGYGLGIAFQMASLFYIVQFMQEKQAKNLLKTLFFAAIATLGHFMFLNFFMAITALCLFVLTYIKFFEGYTSWKKSFMYLLIIALGLGLFLFAPLQNLIKNGPKNYGDKNGFIADTFQSLLRSSYSGASDMGDTPLLWVLIYTLFGLAILHGCGAIYAWWKKGRLMQYFKFASGFAIFWLMALVIQVLHYGFKQAFPVTRMTIFLYLPFALTLAGGICAMQQLKFQKIWAISVGILASVGFMQAANFSYTIEWAGHAIDRDIIDYLKETEGNRTEKEQIGITTNTYFEQGINFYKNQNKIKWIHPVAQWQPHEKKPDTEYLVIYSNDWLKVDSLIYKRVHIIDGPDYMGWNSNISIYKKKTSN
jgi:hypothetical protein